MNKLINNNKTRLRVWLIYTSGICLVFSVMLVLFLYSEAPENLILGEWKEFSWEYEMVNKVDTQTTHYKKISEEVKQLIGENLVIHKSEAWKFFPGGKLELRGSGGLKMLNWKLNGRGHILELKGEKARECYNVTELNESNLVINFETDLEARGIAKLTFIKQ